MCNLSDVMIPTRMKGSFVRTIMIPTIGSEVGFDHAEGVWVGGMLSLVLVLALIGLGGIICQRRGWIGRGPIGGSGNSERLGSKMSSRRRTGTSLTSPLLPRLYSCLLLFFTLIIPTTRAYVPAIPVNDTSTLNLTDDSSLNLKWGGGVGGVYSARVSYQLEADFPTPGSDIGALVHFTEEHAGDNVTTSTPWIAMIECSRNWTHASDYWDVFTLARDRGARAALLYTTTAQSCLINQEYLDDFEKPLNVFATRSRSSAALIEGQFNVTDEQFWHYNETLLNQSFAVVNESLAGTTVPSKTYVIATLIARNSEGQATAYPTPTASPVSASGGTSKERSVPMIILYCAAGIIAILFLSVIVTGAVRALRHPERYGPNAELGDRPPPASTAAGIGQAILDTFPVIKFNRARKQGGRPRDKTVYPSYDARRDDDVEADYAESSCAGSTLNHLKHRDPESPGMEEDGKAIEMVEKQRSQQREPVESSSRPLSDATMIESASHATPEHKSPPRPSASAIPSEPPSSPPSRPVMAGNSKDPEITAAARAFAEQRRSWIQNHMSDERFSAAKPLVETAAASPRSTMSAASGAVGLPPAMATTREQPESRQIGQDEQDDEDEVCPICLLEFEEGDEVRVLPCQLAHSFHKECIDPWLLEVSSSCPLCRKDFAAVPNPTSSELSNGTVGTNNTVTSSSTATTIPTQEHESRIGRFGRYLAFVRRERRRHRDHEDEDTGQAELLPTDRSRRSRRQRRQEERWEQSGPGPF